MEQTYFNTVLKYDKLNLSIDSYMNMSPMFQRSFVRSSQRSQLLTAKIIRNGTFSATFGQP
jgi:hypothetical protein